MTKGGPYSTRTTRTSRSTGETASHYRYENLSAVRMKGGPCSIRMTRTSRATGESASHYRHLEFEHSYDEGRALVNWYDSYESCNW